ncbi:MAG: hypothetical protein NTU62_12510, partial [Spirochaetes bacterium]|nr:hypothetical protein [Spirochaetota bacterium]
MAARSFSPVSVHPDWQAFQDCILRRGTPRRVHNVELGLDSEMQQAVADRFDLEEGLDRDDPFFPLRRQIAIQSFL